jgi:4-hydroxybenzoate polyprenyltransferase
VSTEPLLDEGAGAGSRRVPAVAARIREGVRALRLHQWSKNVLVLAAPVLGHRLEPAVLGKALLAVLAFSLVASAVYVGNDLVDREEDRLHPRKRRRPFASGALPTAAGMALVPALLAAGALAAWPLPAAFVVLLAGYLAASLAYGLLVKRLVVIDVLVLAGLYTARIWAGALATGVPVSEWLASFSMFLFLSLAFLKRASELMAVEGDAPGRGYRAADREQVFTLGTASGYISVLVLALYLSSRDVARLYSHPARLWLLCPLLLYWVSRLWIQARRGEVHDDPVVHALQDPGSYAVGALSALVVWLAT